MLGALIIFPCFALLWLMLCAHFGLVPSQAGNEPG
jgi:hypothetical protein